MIRPLIQGTRLTLVALACGHLALAPGSLQASEALEQLFGILQKKGSITQAEHDMLVAAMRADEAKAGKAAPAPAAAVAATAPAPATAVQASANLEQTVAAQAKRIEQLEAKAKAASVDPALPQKVEKLENLVMGTKGQIEELSRITDNTSPSTLDKAELDDLLADKWYERLKLKGYLQVRGTSVMRNDGAELNVPNDAIANDLNTIGVRRGRLTYSGDLTNHVYLYSQVDFFGSANPSSSQVVSARDYYADVSLDSGRENRIRLGLSKVPFGFANMQSSQNRLALERPDAINSAVEGERDFGAFYYWAPHDIRNRFKDIVKMGLRGSGDYGLVGFGAYSGNGINKADNNGSVHYVARVAYPFEFDNGQFFELGLQGYTGQFSPSASKITVGGSDLTPKVLGNGRGPRDERVGVSAILYPQPFGIETEWNWGRGPVLSNDLRTISSGGLSGGYVQASYRHIFEDQQELIPFIRYQTFDGGRKFAANAPRNHVNEWAIGLRYIPYTELELSLMYSTGTRTNTAVAPYDQARVDYLGLQAQINF